MAISWKRLGAYLAIFGGIQFIIITAIIMTIYPGGYNFFLNSFSQLGQAVTNSVPTPQNWFLFAFTCTLVGACSILFMLAIRTLFTGNQRLFYLSWLGTILGFLAAVFVSALAIFAMDIFSTLHGYSTYAFFFFISSAIIVYTIAIFLNEDYENLYALIGIIVAILAYTYLIGMLLNVPYIESAAMQKVAVYSLILWSAFQGYKLLKVFK
ncbi:MAG: hypothetical protein ACFFCB_06410 [Candidatus Odinarchaeota archaeon]